MKLERMLADALREEAGGRDVDVARLWADTRGRLDRESAVRRSAGAWSPPRLRPQRYSLRSDRLVRFRSEVCAGEAGSVVVPVEEPSMLRNHLGDDPLPPSALSGGRPLLLDHRAYYDHVGVTRPRTLYAGACGTALCLSSVEEDGDSGSTRVPPGAKPHEVSPYFLPNDAPDWREQPYGMWAVYDAADEVADVTYSRGNSLFRAERFTADGWPGTLYLVVAPFDEFTGLTVTPPEERSTHYPAEELPPYSTGARD